jgi:ATP-dependent protease HslVU (ClpYQ) peptidase subunit
MKKIILLLSLLFSVLICNAQAVNTFAGSGVAGSTNGTGTASQFNNPSAICADASHNVYVADSNNHKIRKISATGVVTTLAGSGVAGFDDGAGAVAQFNNPSGICVDYLGNLYVADTNNNKVRKITPAGVVTTLAGSTQGYADGTGTAAKFNFPIGICIVSEIYIYLADTNNNRIRRITTAGVVTTIAGASQGYADGTGTAALFNAPRGICRGNYSNTEVIYVADTNNNRIRRITTAGVVTTFAGSTQGYADGTGTAAKFNLPVGVANDINENVYVTDSNNHRIRKITPIYNSPSGIVVSYAGSTLGYSDGGVSTALFNTPSGIFIDSNILYIADSNNNRIRNLTICDILPKFQYNWNGAFYCSSISSPINVSNIYGTYTNLNFYSQTGLSIDSLTGAFTPNTSIPGNYYVTCNATPYGCPNVNWQVDVVIQTSTAEIYYPDSPYYTNLTTPQPVILSGTGDYLGGNYTSQPSGLILNDSSGEIYPNSIPGIYTVNYYVLSAGLCQTLATTQVEILPQPNIGNISISSSNNTFGLFDTITVDVQLTNATDLYSLYMKLKGNTAVSQYLDYSGYTAGTLFGSNVISTSPTVTNGVYDFGITKVGNVSGYSGGGLFYSFRFVTKNIAIPSGTSFCFYLDNASAYNTAGISCNVTNQGQYCYTFNNQINVWPGDLNKSNTVSTADLLPIGYFYNSTGATRPNATIQWNAQPATLWGYNHSSNNGDAYKVFADSNGDGVINNADQAAIGRNMNQVHARLATPAAPEHFSAQAQQTLASGDLIVTPNNSVINALVLPQTVTFTVSLNNTGGLSSLFGISANLLFDATVFDLSTATIDYTGSIFGTAGTDCMALNYNSTSIVSVGLTRYANAAINGQGLLFKVTLQTKSPLVSLLTQTPVTAYVDAANNQVGDALVIQDAPVTNLTIINNLGVNTIKSNDFILYPNPANEVVNLVMGTNTTELNGLKLKVINLLGQTVEKMNIQSTSMEISTKNWGASGVYFVEITNENNSVLMTKKVIVNKN